MTKRTWKSRIVSALYATRHHYSGNTCIGTERGVSLTTEVLGGKESGRQIESFMTPGQARELAQQLIRAADRVDERLEI